MHVSPRLLGAFSTIIGIGVLVLAFVALWQDGRATWNRAVNSADSLRSAVVNDISRTIELYDLSLRGAVEDLQMPGIEQLPPAIRQGLLFDRSAGAEYLGAILLLNADGDVNYDSRMRGRASVSFADRDYFRAQKDNPNLGLFISAPLEGRLTGGGLAIALSRRISDSTGNFAGVVVGIVRLEYFEKRFQDLHLGEGDVVTLFRDDGRVLTRVPDAQLYAGRDLSGSENFIRFKREGRGAFVGKSVLDDTERLYSFQAVDSLPMIVSVGLSVEAIMAPWREKTLIFGPLTLVLCASLAGLTFLFQRELRRRAAAESELAALAATDALTGLPNRRTFDQAVEIEWRSSRRAEVPLSLLFIDVDHFKTFNDQFGHEAGDHVLRLLARTIEANIRRPRDRVTRYGGEEFIVILPETGIEGALRVAAKVEAGVRALRVPDDDAPAGAITVSIGVAAMTPGPDGTVSELIAAADAALYRAKEGGRNRIEADGPLPPD